MSRISRTDWLAIGLESLAVEGVSGLTIDALTRKLKVTKGSFYHHFKNFEDFKIALLEFWEQQYTSRIIAFAESAEGPEQIFSRFLTILTNESPAVEIAIRSWALQDEPVRAYVQRIDELRIDTARRWFQRVNNDSLQANSLASLFNALLVGCYSVFPPLLREDLQQNVSLFLKLAGVDI